jgi:hypothetical protein
MIRPMAFPIGSGVSMAMPAQEFKLLTEKKRPVTCQEHGMHILRCFFTKEPPEWVAFG